MLRLSLLFLLVFPRFYFGQGADHYFSEASKEKAYCNIEGSTVLYRDYKNKLNFFSQKTNKNLFLSAKDALIEPINEHEAYLTPLAKNQRSLIVELKTSKKRDTILLGTFYFDLKNMPLPGIYFGPNKLDSALHTLGDSLVLPHSWLNARQAADFSLKTVYKVSAWSVSVNGQEFSGSGDLLNKEVKSAMYQAEENELIRFNYVIIEGSGEIKNLKVPLDFIYRKTTGNTVFTLPQSSVRCPG